MGEGAARTRAADAPERVLRPAASVPLSDPKACLTCPDLLTTREHLPPTATSSPAPSSWIDTARTAGHARIVEQNERLKLNLINIVEGLEALPGDSGRDDH